MKLVNLKPSIVLMILVRAKREKVTLQKIDLTLLDQISLASLPPISFVSAVFKENDSLLTPNSSDFGSGENLANPVVPV